MSTIPPLSSGDVHPQCITEEGLWSTALMDCFEDAATCCYGFWCCPCLSCTVSGRLQQPYCLPLCDLPCLPPAGLALRLTMRNKYKIKGTICRDICTSCFCVWCSWCQLHRELRAQDKGPITVNVTNVVHAQPVPMMMVNQNVR
uniref:Plac8 onzin related protein 6 n=1 Tax=Periophthalmus magnuspinnatus TaxID=409849 RepID=A0A3B4BFN1_9GOBI